MGKITGFIEYERENPKNRAIDERLKDYKEIKLSLPEETLSRQGARCMNCGIPFCNWGCPLGNLIPDFNHMVYKGQWEKAFKKLSLTNPFPEFTGRICPALCEGSCTLALNREPVTIEQMEVSIVEKAFKEGWIKPSIPKVRTGKKVAVVGSGPSGLAAAFKLNSYGHNVTVFEKDDEVGGILRYGIPDFKLEKSIVERRVNLMKEEGIEFIVDCEVGTDYSISKLLKEFNSIVLTGGCRIPRDLNIEGRELKGIHFAMEFLAQQNKRVAGKGILEREITAKDKVVVVIGGGDTGSDCIGTSRRQGAKEVYQYEIMPKPPVERDETMPWPEFPKILKVTTSHEEGCSREWCVLTKRFSGKNGEITSLQGVKVEWKKDENGRLQMKEIPGSEFEQKVDIVLIAMGFTNSKFEGMLEELGVKLDNMGNVYTDKNYMTSVEGVFSGGDMRTGQSLVVKAINEGIQVSESVDEYLMKK
ncbi:glutamate synthase small subunit [Clostridium bovifaecis]|uniref:Glutamate synthase small subunit n=1 Tax=Clostridium bovifaecis TaxID=2184719 RepID=A0A6I6F679_9CLOT|nr:glutamate synthase small subunit [Clostridium bovifaecis]